MNDTGGEKSCLNRESNPGCLAYRANTLTTELSRHKDHDLHHLTCMGLKSVRITKIQVYRNILYMIGRIIHRTEHSEKHRIREGCTNDKV